jgi:SPP1 family predicted phage head-tail adaptor
MRRVETVDAGGQPSVSGSALDICRCSIEPLSGREYFEQSGETSTVDTRVKTWYRKTLADLSPADWIEVDGKIYDVVSVINAQLKNRVLVIMCKVRDRD